MSALEVRGAGDAAGAGPFAELCAKSCFSFLEGASMPDELVREAAKLGLAGLALVDRDGLYGSVRAHVAAREAGLPLVVGATLTLEGDEAEAAAADLAPPRSLALLVRSAVGYRNLCRLLTRTHADHEKGEAGLRIDEVAEAAEGLVAIAPYPEVGEAFAPLETPHDAEMPRRETLRGVETRRRDFALLREAFGESAFVAVPRRLDGRDPARVAWAEAVSARFGLDVVATMRPLFHAPARKPLADVVHCIRRKTTLDRAGTSLAANAEAVLRGPAAVRRLFAEHPAWVDRTAAIAASCTFGLDALKYRFPCDVDPRDGEVPAPSSGAATARTADERLRQRVEEGCRERYPQGVPPAVRAQIEKELGLISRIEVAPYFLSVQEIVQIARDKRILCQGRGSAANSAVCYVLGVTAVDPARSNLLFERFLSEERAEPPDIDVDFEHERREEVIQELYARYGRDRAAMVSEVIRYRGRSALREVGKVFGLGADQVDRLSAVFVHNDRSALTEVRIAEVGLDPKDARLRRVLELAGELEGMPRHLSIHVGGFVLSADPLDHVAPVEPARMEGRTVIPWDKDDLDDLRFFKVDVLALGMLTAIRKTFDLLPEGEPCAVPGDPIATLARIPAEDPVVYDAVEHADTVGVFQIESRAQMAMLPRLRPRTFYDLVIQVAIVRPGPIQGGMVHPYLRRRAGKESSAAPHPCLEPILERTLGVPLFQEQVMQIAMVGAGYSAGDADQLRRDMAAWKKHGRLARHRERLLAGFAARGITSEFGQRLYKQVEGFGEYGFPESHAASFALLVYASSWLKVHHPAAFACALLNAQPMGFYSPSSIVRDVQRHGVEVRPVCVQASRWDSTLEPATGDALGGPGPEVEEPPAWAPPPRGPARALRLGLRQIRGLTRAGAEGLVTARVSGGPFSDMHDLVRRTGLHKRDLELLAEAGALASLAPERREALWKTRAPRGEGLFDGMALEGDGDVGLPPLRPLETLVLDYGRVGLSVHDHPLKHLRARLKKEGVRRAADLPRTKDRQRVTVAGLVIGRQRPETASGVTFVTLEDETGVVNVVVTKTVFAEFHDAARHAKLVRIDGTIEMEGEVIHVLAKRIERLELPVQEPLPFRSRDFH